MKFSREFLNEMRCGDRKDTSIVDKIFHAHKRWEVVFRIIFCYENKFYEYFDYVPATESQEYRDDWIDFECEEVFPINKNIIVYEKI